MSYCRWSTDNFRCDLYVYEHANDYWSINVASLRHRVPPLVAYEHLRVMGGWMPWWLWKPLHDLSWWITQRFGARPIGLSHDGETFREPTAAAAAERVASLRAEGYRCPDYVERDLLEEHFGVGDGRRAETAGLGGLRDDAAAGPGGARDSVLGPGVSDEDRA